MPMEKTFNAATAEPRIYATWDREGAFAAGANASREETFSILLPPPNVTGVLHMGHAFNQTLMDVLIRWHRMRGFDTLWQPGLDHAGIATQMVVERELAASQQPDRRTLGREAFTRKVWDWKEKSGGTIVEQSKRLGASMDWSRAAFTMAGAPGGGEDHPGPNFHDAVIKVFVDMYDKGLIYRGKRLVNWDPHFETAISDLEVENIEVDGHMWHFKYPLAGGATYEYVEKDEDGNVTLRETRDYISIATTRPETMLGDGAVAVHPSDQRYAPIVGKLCEIPVGPKEHRRLIPIITDEYPDPDFGSGAVKITGAHDFNDYGVASRGGIPMYRLMDTKGAMRSDGVPYAEAASRAQAIAEGAEFTGTEVDTLNLVPDDLRGLDRLNARQRVIAQITEEGLAVMTDADDPRLGKRREVPAQGRDGGKQDGAAIDPAPAEEPGPHGQPPEVPLVEAKKIMAPYGDRSKVVIEPMLTDQWFVDTDKIVGPALDSVRSGEVTIMPEQDRKVYFNWLENIEPWCISRQLWWGHQIPVWYAPEFTEDGAQWRSFCAPNQTEALAQMAEFYRHENFRIVSSADEARALFEADIADRADEGAIRQPTAPLSVPVYRDPDVLDTWFSSGLWPIGTLGWPDTENDAYRKYFPTSTLITGFDIIFFWVARMMMMQYAVVGEKPFDTVYVHALVRDEKGKKMSKSLGNVLDPLELIDEYGADAVRFTLTSMAAMGRDLKLSTARIQGYRNFTTKLWNAVRFAEMNEALTANAPSDGIPTATAPVNRWILGETARIREAVDAALEGYRFNDAASALYAFVWGVVCDWYVEFTKPLLADGHPAKAETQATMAWVLDQCMILLHPIMPFITEELWGTTGTRAKPLIHTDWPTYTADIADPEADAEMRWVIGLIEQVRSARAQMGVPGGAEVPMVHTGLDAAAQTAWDRNADLIRRLARVTDLTQVDSIPKGSIAIPVQGGDVALPLADIIDVDKERARLEKSLTKLEKEVKGLSGRVNNPKFVASAPEEVVEEARQNLTEREGEAETLRTALTRLAEIG